MLIMLICREYTDNTTLTFDGKNLLCTVYNIRDEGTCNHLKSGVPTEAVIMYVNFDPRKGEAHKNDWSRNRYTLRGSYSQISCEPRKYVSNQR